MKILTDRVAVVTGAAGGIGRVLVQRLAAAGCHLALVDIDGPALDALAGSLAGPGRISTHVVDVRDHAQLDRLAAEVERQHGSVSLLVASAGVTVFGAFEQHSADDVDWLLDTNIRGVVHCCRALLPLLRSASETHGEAHIVCLSSMVGMVGVPIQSLYSTSKYAVRGFSASLRAELSVHGIGVTAVLPGAVRDSFLLNGRMFHPATVQAIMVHVERFGCAPERVVERLLRAVRRNRAEVLIGLDAHLVRWLTWLLPPFLPWLMGWSYRTHTPKGRIEALEKRSS